MANADTPEDALTARNNGAQGIGLCRTEHMVILSSLYFSMFLVICVIFLLKKDKTSSQSSMRH